MLELNTFLPYLNSSLGFLFRRALCIPDFKHHVVKLTPEACHLHLGGDQYRAILYANRQFMQAAYSNLDWFMRSLHHWDKIAYPALNMGFDTYTSQPDETSGIDTTLDDSNPTTNYGTGAGLGAGESNASTSVYRSLIKFDFSSISWLAVINSATLSIWLFANAASNTRTCRVYRQKRAWVETQATWNVYSTGNSWQTAGGFGPNDCEQTDIGSRSLAAAESSGEKQWTLTASAVEAMVNGGWTNNGFLLKNDYEVNDQHSFRASAYTTSSERPKLVMDYTSQDTGGMLL